MILDLKIQTLFLTTNHLWYDKPNITLNDNYNCEWAFEKKYFGKPLSWNEKKTGKEVKTFLDKKTRGKNLLLDDDDDKTLLSQTMIIRWASLVISEKNSTLFLVVTK